MGFFADLFGTGSSSKERLRDELLRLDTQCARSSSIFSDPRGVEAATAELNRLKARADEIRAELKRRGLAETETGAEVMARLRGRQ